MSRTPPDDDRFDLPVIDLDTYQRRHARRVEEQLRRKRARRRLIAGTASLVVVAGAGGWLAFGRDSGSGPQPGGSDSAAAPAGTTSASTEPRPVSVPESEPLPPLDASETTDGSGTPAPTPGSGEPGSDTSPRAQGGAPDDGEQSLREQGASTAGAVPAPAESAARGRPVVWVQAGHLPPGEPGYKAQTGAGGGPFGSEQAFNTRVRDLLITQLKAAGVDARPNGALVTPLGSRGAVFISVHFDSPGGSAAIGHAISVPGRHENWYRGEGTGTASPTPYPDSAPHRDHTEVTPATERASKRLATAVAARYSRIFTPANGAGSRFRGVEPRNGNVRMMHFYGYYRTTATARILIETGAAGADDRFLAKTDLIAKTLASGITDYLRASGRLR